MVTLLGLYSSTILVMARVTRASVIFPVPDRSREAMLGLINTLDLEVKISPKPPARATASRTASSTSSPAFTIETIGFDILPPGSRSIWLNLLNSLTQKKTAINWENPLP